MTTYLMDHFVEGSCDESKETGEVNTNRDQIVMKLDPEKRKMYEPKVYNVFLFYEVYKIWKVR